MKKFFVGGFSLLISVLIPSFPLWAKLSLKDLDLPASFPVSSQFYKIDSVTPHPEEAGFLKFHITSSHAPYETEGLVPLRKLQHEIEIIERIERGEAGSGFGKGAVDSVAATGKGFVKLFTHPMESGKGIGKSVGKLGGKIGGAFEEKEEGEKTSWGEKILGGSEREIAKELTVDIYTTNPHLKELLVKMAKSRLGGKGAAVVGKLLIPVSGLVSVTVTASGINNAADQFVNDTGRSDLYHANEDALLLLGFDPASVKQLLNLPYYSPREATYLRFYLERLKEVENFRQILKTALDSKSLWQARKILYEAQIAADSMTEKSKYLRLECFREGLAIREAGRVILITPYDYLDRSELGTRVIEKARGVKKDGSKNSLEIWNAGKVTPAFFLASFAQGIKVRSWLLFLRVNDPSV